MPKGSKRVTRSVQSTLLEYVPPASDLAAANSPPFRAVRMRAANDPLAGTDVSPTFPSATKAASPRACDSVPVAAVPHSACTTVKAKEDDANFNVSLESADDDTESGTSVDPVPSAGCPKCAAYDSVCSRNIYTQTWEKFVTIHDLQEFLEEHNYVSLKDLNAMKVVTKSQVPGLINRYFTKKQFAPTSLRKSIEQCFGGDLMLVSRRNELKAGRRRERELAAVAADSFVSALGTTGDLPSRPIVIEDDADATLSELHPKTKATTSVFPEWGPVDLDAGDSGPSYRPRHSILKQPFTIQGPFDHGASSSSKPVVDNNRPESLHLAETSTSTFGTERVAINYGDVTQPSTPVETGNLSSTEAFNKLKAAASADPALCALLDLALARPPIAISTPARDATVLAGPAVLSPPPAPPASDASLPDEQAPMERVGSPRGRTQDPPVEKAGCTCPDCTRCYLLLIEKLGPDMVATCNCRSCAEHRRARSGKRPAVRRGDSSVSTSRPSISDSRGGFKRQRRGRSPSPRGDRRVTFGHGNSHRAGPYHGRSRSRGGAPASRSPGGRHSSYRNYDSQRELTGGFRGHSGAGGPSHSSHGSRFQGYHPK